MFWEFFFSRCMFHGEITLPPKKNLRAVKQNPHLNSFLSMYIFAFWPASNTTEHRILKHDPGVSANGGNDR